MVTLPLASQSCGEQLVVLLAYYPRDCGGTGAEQRMLSDKKTCEEAGLLMARIGQSRNQSGDHYVCPDGLL